MNTVQSSSHSYAYILNKAWPIILANAAVPLLGLVDTAVIGHFGRVSELAGLAVASLLFNFIYWGFGFLRMGTTGFVARKTGENHAYGIQLVIIQSLSLAFIISIILLITQVFILYVGIRLLAPPMDVIPSVESYFYIRVFSAPATLATYVVLGTFIGRGDSKTILFLQVFLNGMNAVLDILFVTVFDMGIQGIAIGTCLAEYLTFMLGVFILYKKFDWLTFFRTLKIRSISQGYASVLVLNNDIFIRTLFLLLGFSFFTHISGSFGEITLAANYILLQLVAFSAFFLDGFAHVLESLVGKAIGEKSLADFKNVFFKSTVLAVFCAFFLSCLIFFGGEYVIHSLTSMKHVSQTAVYYLPFAVVYIAIAAGAFQLDGLFIGAGYSSAMRNCSIVSTIVLVGAWFFVFRPLGNTGLWWAFMVYVAVRTLTLAGYMPKLIRQSFGNLKAC